MSCTNCGSNNCSCSDNCPNKTSDITVFDGQLNVLEVPCGASLNDILAILTALTNIEGDITTLSQQQVYVDVTKTGANTLLATPSGGIAPYTYQWFVQDSRGEITISGSSTSSSVSLLGTNPDISDALIKVRVTDANGRRANDCYYLRIAI